MTSAISARLRPLVPVLGLLILTAALLLPAGSAWAAEIDFGLPLFNVEELRLEKTKAPDFNLSLLKKYLSEQQKNTLAQLHAMSQWVTLMKLSDTPRAAELEKIAIAFLETKSFTADRKAEALRYLYLRGLMLAANREDDPKNARDHAFEELLLKGEEPFERTPEYHLVKGILFQLLRNRPNGYFSPMKPFEDLKRAAALAPAEAGYYYALGQAFRLLGSEEPALFLAIASFEKASSLAPGNGKLQHSLLGIYMGLHESYQAQAKEEPFWLQEAVYKKILTLSPNNPHALNNLGFLYAEYGVHRELAQSLVQRAVDQIPDNPGFRDSLGWAAFKNTQFDKAVQELEKAVNMSPDVYEPHYHLGTVYYVTKRHEKAIRMYEKAVELRPTSAEALNNYAYLLTEIERDIDKAEKMAVRAVKIEPNNASYIDTYGWVLFKQGKVEEAIRTLRKAASLAPDVGEILMHLGKAYLHIAQFETALEYFRQALKADPGLENMQRELYQAIVLRAQYRAIAEYHGVFGAKAEPVHLNRILLQLVRIFQEEGMFERAIEMTRLCERLKKGEIDLSKPLFDYYTIETASGTATATAATAPSADAVIPGETETAEEQLLLQDAEELDETASATSETAPESAAAGGLEEPVFPVTASVPLALHMGPAAATIAADHLLAFPEFGSLSITLFVERLARPARHSTLLVTFPGLATHDALAPLRHHLGLLGCPPIDAATTIAGFPAFRARMGRWTLWALQADDRLFLGTGREPSADEIRAMSGTFPPQATTLFGILLDWKRWESEIPILFRPWIESPIAPYTALHARHILEGSDVTEIVRLVPQTPVDQKFMKHLADSLFGFKRRMLEWGIPVEVRVSANDACVELEASYRGFGRWLGRWLESWKPFSWLIQPRLEALECVARRLLFSRDPAELATLCPGSGTVTIDGPSGSLRCTKHPVYGLFPFITSGEDRCAFTRARLEAILASFGSAVRKHLPKEGLINRVVLDYNMSPCPASGSYTLNPDGTVGCSAHPRPAARKK
ncbi:MAG TPA: tetratricopeptide repeat protein [Candidatus Ozemobacteraceae bacterium]|nr:tetratricopeptide repeat protein [Candidatus Ozemobacteraceae bacterium]